MADTLEQPGEETCGGRLAVGAGDHGRALRQVLGQAGEDLRVDGAGHVAGQGGAAASFGDAAEGAGGLAGPYGDGLSDQLATAPTAWVTAVQQSSLATAFLASFCVLVVL